MSLKNKLISSSLGIVGLQNTPVKLPSSKSMWIRALLLQACHLQVSIKSSSAGPISQDVKATQNVLGEWRKGSDEYNVQDSAALLRFLVFLLLSKPAEYTISLSQNLLQRPHQEMIEVLKQFNVKAELSLAKLKLNTTNAKLPSTVNLSLKNTSQIASGIALLYGTLLKDVVLEFDAIEMQHSISYFQLTLEMLKKLGVYSEISLTTEGKLSKVILKHSKEVSMDKRISFEIEPDMSAAFAVASYYALHKKGVLLGDFTKSLQPDFEFIRILKKIGVQFDANSECLTVLPAETQSLVALETDLRETPDLFCSLAVLCAFAQGKSRLRNLGTQNQKESKRLSEIKFLLGLWGVSAEIINQDLIIYGKGASSLKLIHQSYEYDPKGDHRLAMSAALLEPLNPDFKISHREVVHKSFPGFWEAIS